jgi:hypothetical protein
VQINTNWNADELDNTYVAISECSRSIVSKIPINGLIEFVDKPGGHGIKFPEDLERVMISLYSEFE